MFNIAYHGTICSYFSVYPIFDIITQLSPEETVRKYASVAAAKNNYERINTHMYFEIDIICDIHTAYELKMSVEHIKEMYDEHYKQFNSIVAELVMFCEMKLIKNIKSTKKYIECPYYNNFYHKLKHITASIYGWGIRITVPKTFIVLIEMADVTGSESLSYAMGYAWSQFEQNIKAYLIDNNLFKFDFIALPPSAIVYIYTIEDTNICLINNEQSSKVYCFTDPGFTIPIMLRDCLIKDYEMFSAQEDFRVFAEKLTRNNKQYEEYKKGLQNQINELMKNMDKRYKSDIMDIDAEIKEKEKKIGILQTLKK